jgi:hypothetical protein
MFHSLTVTFLSFIFSLNVPFLLSFLIVIILPPFLLLFTLIVTQLAAFRNIIEIILGLLQLGNPFKHLLVLRSERPARRRTLLVFD